MADKILGYKELLKTLLEYHIHLIKRLSREGYEQIFSVLLIPLPNDDEKRIRELVKPLLRESDRLFYIEGNLIAMLPGTDWNGAQKVHETILEALGESGIEDCVVEYPTDGNDAFTLIGNLYARLEEIRPA
ncbi:hypothetical protein NNO_0735 [Hydrogenimonas sp.]|nr:hypothetical protein NNO_0735 [Hydrogenimonas sp.]